MRLAPRPAALRWQRAWQEQDWRPPPSQRRHEGLLGHVAQTWAKVRARADGWAVVAPGMMMDDATLRERGARERAFRLGASTSNAGPGETRNPLPLRNGSTKAPPRGTEVVCRPLPQPFPQCLGDSGSQPSIGAAGVSLARAALCITSVGTAIDTAIAPSAVRVYVWKPG